MNANPTTDHDLIYECPHCKHQAAVDESLVGKVIDCPKCDHPFDVPAPSARLVNPRAASDIEEHMHVKTPATDETVLVEIHPAMFGNHPFYYTLLLIGIIGGAVAAGWAFTTAQPVIGMVAVIAAIAGLIFFAVWRVQVLCTTLSVTSKRTILRRGFFSKNTSEVQHDDVRNIQFDQNVPQRILGTGDLAISSSGQDDMEISIKGIPDPESIVKLVRDHQ